MGLYAIIALVSSSLGLAVGASLPSGESALVAGPTLMVIYMVLGVLNPSGQPQKMNRRATTTSSKEKDDGEADSCPRILAPLKICSPIKWSIESLLCSEFRGLEFTRDLRSAPQMGAIALVGSGDQALAALGLHHQTTENCVKAMITLLISHIAVAIGALAMRRQRHVSLNDGLALVHSNKLMMNNTDNEVTTAATSAPKKNIKIKSLYQRLKFDLKHKTN
mmetsp:Transcript_5791/g.7700  ORF Transcript_5791/g.7700 Transcript_5791/m.7700 type:complete len:221 (-) Transcript_5791:102-764(-)